MKRAKLVIVDDEPPRLVPVDAPEGRLAYRDGRTGRVITSQDGMNWEGAVAEQPSCATCKWAEVDSHDLRCGRTMSPDGSLAYVDNGDGMFIVAPTFGCVQWEGK